jgi:transposase InsO family protein
VAEFTAKRRDWEHEYHHRRPHLALAGRPQPSGCTSSESLADLFKPWLDYSRPAPVDPHNLDKGNRPALV